MKVLRLLLVSLALLLVCGTVQAQFGKRLGKAIENAAKNTTVRKAEQKTDEAVSKGIDKMTDPDTYKDSSESSNTGTSETSVSTQSKDTPQQGINAVEMAYAKSDFVSGDEIIFEDDLVGEQQGEFPSQWDLKSGDVEIAKLDGKNVIALIKSAEIKPLMKEPKSYLTEKFTVELDFWMKKEGEDAAHLYTNGLYFYDTSQTKEVFNIQWRQSLNYKSEGMWITPSGERLTFDFNLSDADVKPGAWNKIAVSFNKRALKVYLNGIRVVNIPNATQPQNLSLRCSGKQDNYIKNVRIAKGAVPLYDRMMTDGKIITYGITFDVGKSTIKPESMGEINRIATLMKENPDLKFSVEGHTDSTGSAVANQTLSDARSKAVVDKLVEMGVAKDRLSSAGKGQTSPIADNSTDEGRAKNRRVEFVKL